MELITDTQKTETNQTQLSKLQEKLIRRAYGPDGRAETAAALDELKEISNLHPIHPADRARVMADHQITAGTPQEQTTLPQAQPESPVVTTKAA